MRIALPLLALGLAACGPRIDDGPLAGQVAGADWTVAGGEATGDGDTVSVDLYGSSYAACDELPPDEPQLLFSMPTTPGEYKLGLFRGQTITFVPSPGENLIAVQGLLRVDSVTETEVSAGLVADFDGDNSVSGTFTITRCEDSF